MRMSARSRRRRSLTLWLRPSLALSLACTCLAPCFVGKLRQLVTTQEETGGRRASGLLTLSLGSADAGGHWRLRLWPCGAPTFGRPVWASTGWRRSRLWPLPAASSFGSGCYGGGFGHGNARLPLGNGEQGLPALCGPRGDRGASALGVPLVAGQLRSSGDDVLDQKLWELTARPSGGGSPGRNGRRRPMLDVALCRPRARASIRVRRPRREPSAMAPLHG